MVKIPQPNLNLLYPPAGVLASIFTAAFALYLVTLNPALFRNDSPETITACVTLGVSHPPSYPLHSLLGRLFSLLQIGNPAFTLNLFSAFLSAIGVCLFAANIWAIIVSIEPYAAKPILVLSAFSGSSAFALSNNYWSCSLSAKGGIYILQMVADLALLLSVLQVSRGGQLTRNRATYFYFPLFIFSLGFVNHWPTQTLLIPAFYLITLKPISAGVFKKIRTEPKIIFTASSLFLLVLSLYLYLPLRSNLDPELNFGVPTTLPRWVASIFRLNYAHQETLLSAVPTALSTIADKGAYIFRRLWGEFHPLAWPFFFLGAIFLSRKKYYLVFFSSLILVVISASLFYLSVPPVDFWHLDDHLLTLNWAFGLVVSAGLYWTLLQMNRVSFFRFSPLLKACLCAGLTAGPPALIFAKHISVNDQKNEFLYYGYGLSGLKSMERNSIYFAESDYDYFSMLYLKSAEAKRKDVVLLSTPFLSNPYEYPLIQKNYPDLTRTGVSLPSKLTDETSFFAALQNGAIDRPLYCSFSNGAFEQMALQHFPSFYFQPSGILIKCLGSSAPPTAQSLVPFLNDFWEHYLSHEKRSPNPINGLLLGFCAYPFTDAAYYLELRRDFSRWDWFYDRALSLIQIKSWLAEEWEKKGEGDLGAGKNQEALAAFEESALEHLKAGEFEKSRTCLQKAITLDPANQTLIEILNRVKMVPEK